ncbi:unnamed protein product [Pleuronectes platessa]|uniref:Uncharacterized protein n=1 Tax=Pleuronectes platessa TaxID=8262 RepID=A0A9N7TNE4_PLEPL|nr:unnamed protein product [Pleuronectes platessa]
METDGGSAGLITSPLSEETEKQKTCCSVDECFQNISKDPRSLREVKSKEALWGSLLSRTTSSSAIKPDEKLSELLMHKLIRLESVAHFSPVCDTQLICLLCRHDACGACSILGVASVMNPTGCGMTDHPTVTVLSPMHADKPSDCC